MSDYVNEIKKLYKGFQKNNEYWKNAVSAANENTSGTKETTFCSTKHPYFYTGNLIDPKSGKLNKGKAGVKYVLITMNPALVGEECPKQSRVSEQKRTLENFLAYQNNWFKEQSDARRYSPIFGNCNKVVKALNGFDQKCETARYGYLEEHAAVVDWFPFYSKNFSLRVNNEEPFRRLELVLGLSAELGQRKALACGGDIKNALNRLSKKNPDLLSKEKRGVKFQNKKIEVFRYGRSNIYSFPIGYKSQKYLKEVAGLINAD